MHFREQHPHWLQQLIRQEQTQPMTIEPAANKSDKSLPAPAPANAPKQTANHKRKAQEQEQQDSRMCSQAPRKRKFRLRKQRYRDQLQFLQERLQLDINSLKQEIIDLQLKKSLIQTHRLFARQARVDSALGVVHEYCDLFRHGVLPATHPHFLVPSQFDPRHHMKQQHFLQNYMDDQLEFGGSIGVETFVTQWQRYCECHRNLVLDKLTIGVVGDWETPIVVVTANLHGFMTRDTIQTIYPHILAQEQLCQRLIGVYIEYPVNMKFHFDDKGKIVRYEAHVDFVRALMMVLGGIEEVTLIVQEALVTEYCMIGKLDETGQQEPVEQVEEFMMPVDPALETSHTSKLDLEFILS